MYMLLLTIHQQPTLFEAVQGCMLSLPTNFQFLLYNEMLQSE